MNIFLLFVVFASFEAAFTWPDGAPCLSKVMKDMYPSAKEHTGGFRNDDPPYRITVSKLCYYEGNRIRVVLEAQEGRRFKGFALQARAVGTKKRVGEFARDDNGSWKFQCFHKKNAITHSHPDQKKTVPVVWFTWDDEQNDIEFVATVVENIRSFWHESVKSVVIPHCSRGKATTIRPYEDDVLYHPVARSGIREAFHPHTVEPTRTTTLPTTIRTTTPFITTTTKGPCIDRHPSCDAWTDFCESKNWYVLQQCRVTCGDCIPETGHHFAVTQRPQFPGTEAPRPRGNCPDKDPSCVDWYHLCSSRSEIRQNCPGTCNTCHLVQQQQQRQQFHSHNPQSSGSSSCRDKDANCRGWSSMCQTFEHIRKKCMNTCKMC